MGTPAKQSKANVAARVRATKSGKVQHARNPAGRIKKSVSLGAGAVVLDRHAGGNASAYVDEALVEKGQRDNLRNLVEDLIEGHGGLAADNVAAGQAAYASALARLDAGETA